MYPLLVPTPFWARDDTNEEVVGAAKELEYTTCSLFIDLSLVEVVVDMVIGVTRIFVEDGVVEIIGC